MPKQIKKPKIKPVDKKFRIAAVAGMIMSLLFLAAIFSLIKVIVDTEGKLPTTVLFAAYILYFASCVATLVCGVRAYSKEDNFTDLFQSILVFASIVSCVLNLRFSLIMLFSAYKLNGASSTLIGSQTYTEFISSQYTNWICIVVGTVITIVVGILGIVKLAKNKKH